MSYAGVISEIQVSQHPNADRLQIGYCHGARVVVGLETKSGDLGIFFPSDGQLSDEFMKANDLYPRFDSEGNKLNTTYFDDKRRIRAQNLRQVKSEGYWVPLSYLSYTKYDLTKLKHGDQITELNKIPICNKYYSQATLRAIESAKKTGIKIKEVKGFPEHSDTAQFRFANIRVGDIVYISNKLHGTSVRYGFVPVLQRLPLWKKLLNRVAKIFNEYEHEFVVGSRRVVLATDSKGQLKGGYYGDGSPYAQHINEVKGKINHDEVIYGEIVGYLHTGTAMFVHDTSSIKEIKKQYGQRMVYSYGNPEGQSSFYVYRITQNGVELSWNQVVRRCKELGVNHVPNIDTLIFNGNRDKLNSLVESYLEGPDMLDSRHIREGVCLRVECEEGTKIYKEKSFTFKVLEGIVKDSEVVDLEEIA